MKTKHVISLLLGLALALTLLPTTASTSATANT